MNALQKVEPINQQVSTQFDPSQIELLKTTICKGASDDELRFFISVCQKTGLDPFSRQIYSIPRGNQRTIQVSVDGLRAIADRTGKYAPGKPTEYAFDKEGGLFSATAYIKKQTSDGSWHEIGVTAFWSEYNGKNNIWRQYSYQMLSKCAECLALRKAFPAQLSGLYGHEEMQQSEIEPNVKQLYIDVISLDHAKELSQLLNDCSDESQKGFNEYIRKSYQTDGVEGLPEKDFEKIKKILIKKRDEHQKMLAEKEMTINVVKDEE